MDGRMVLVILLLVGFSVATFGCDSGGGETIGPIILITNQWRAEGNRDHEFDLNSPDDHRSEGAFRGEETLPREGFFEFNELVGFWSNGYIQFTVDRSDGVVRYTGEFNEANTKRLEFTSSAGGLVIVRD